MKRRIALVSMAALLLLGTMAGLCALANESAAAGSLDHGSATVRTDLPADILAWLSLMPELSKAQAPSWLKIGTRISYHVMSAAREGDNSPAGESIVQYDIVSNDGATVLAAAAVHVIGSGGSLGAPRDTGFIAGVPGVGDAWMDPASLAKAEKHATRDLTITHTSTNVNGVATKAVRFEYIQGASRSVSVFDEARGVLLYRIQASGNMDTAKQSSIVSEFISVRQPSAAWSGGATPAWAQAGKQLRYEGSMTVNVMYGSPGTQLPLVMLCSVASSSPAGVLVKWETYLSGAKTEERYSLYSSALPSGGIFLPSAALNTLKPGKVIDTDPITGVAVSVAQSLISLDGRQLLGIVHEGRSFKRVYGYDRQTGMLSYYRETSQDGVASVIVELKLK